MQRGVCEMVSSKKSIDMCSGPLFPKIWQFAFPFMLSGLLQRLYHAADVIVVGRYAGQDALAGVGTTGSLITLILNLFLGLSAGVTVVLGRAIGAKKEKDISQIVHTSMLVSIICGAFVSIIGIIFTYPLLVMIGVPDSVMPHAKAYMQISFSGKMFMLIYNFGAAVLRAKGDTKRPLYIVTVSGIINVVLNLFFVLKLGMAADGVALATIIAQFFNGVAILYILLKEDDNTRLYFNKLKINFRHLKDIAVVGVPAGIQSTIFSFSNVIIQSSVNSFGPAAIAGSAAAVSVDGFFYIALNSFFQTSMAFVSQNFGAKNYERIKKTVLYCLLSVGMVWIAIIFITVFAGKFLIGIYAPGNEEAISWGIRRLLIVGCAYGLCGCMEVMSGALRGIGYSFLSMISAIAGVCGIRIVWIMTVFQYFRSYEILFVSFPLSWLGTFMFHSACFIWGMKKYKSEITEKIEKV